MCPNIYCEPAKMTTQPAAPVTLDEEGTFRKATTAENMEILLARLGDKMSPAERRELQEAIDELHKLKRIEDMKDVPEPVAEVIDFDQGFKFGPQRKVQFFRFGEPLPPPATLLYGPEVIELLAAEREQHALTIDVLGQTRSDRDYYVNAAADAQDKLAKVMEALRELYAYIRDSDDEGLAIHAEPMMRAAATLSELGKTPQE